MEWRRLAFKNGWRNARRYAGYLASATLAVLVFFIFALFLHNPFVTEGHMNSSVRYIIEGFRYIVGAFAVVFIVFFHSSMMRYRNREFGLFLTLGMTPAQVGRMIFLEGLLLGGTALSIGMGLGLLFGKMFLLAIGNILGVSEPIPFVLPGAVFTSTITLFGAVFVLESLYLGVRMSLRTPKSLILGARTQQKAPKASLGRVLLSLVSLGLAYAMAVFLSAFIVITFFPILILVGIGTYFLFTQTMVFVLKSLRKRPLSGTALLVVSRLTFRMGDHARMLTLVTMLCAIVLTGMGAVTGIQSINDLNSTRVAPVALNVVYQDVKGDQLAAKPEAVRKILQAHGLGAGQELQAQMVLVQVQAADGSGKPVPTWAMRQVDFDQWTQRNLNAHPILSTYYKLPTEAKPGEPRLIVAYPLVMKELFPNHDVVVKSGTGSWSMLVEGQYDARVFNEDVTMPTDFVLVMDDSDFRQVQAQAAPESLWTTAGWMVPDWHDTKGAVQDLNQLAGEDVKQGRALVSNTLGVFEQGNQVLEVTLFAGLFVSTLFFLASCSAIYFRLFAQQEEDARQFASLRRIGFERAEAGRVLTVELMLLFFLPFLVAVLHSSVAMQDLSNLLAVQGSVWSSYLLVVGISILCFLAYYLVARVRYLRQVWR
ncbi:ABC transporter permease [Tumebacillus sp. ITR2]|uniref:ABC transporter permease n=1 Tax=Tumebacillus amylolyticus TaxID=2801339 RepID=A0ABS1JEK0_9BACL|nr:ABC transporter permease [Tumebacillus amylolyticus]MBL0388711.1 ABC transporter permease [Tumebacillus amylolyticus]